jgi:hypothetical protein
MLKRPRVCRCVVVTGEKRFPRKKRGKKSNYSNFLREVADGGVRRDDVSRTGKGKAERNTHPSAQRGHAVLTETKCQRPRRREPAPHTRAPRRGDAERVARPVAWLSAIGRRRRRRKGRASTTSAAAWVAAARLGAPHATTTAPPHQRPDRRRPPPRPPPPRPPPPRSSRPSQRPPPQPPHSRAAASHCSSVPCKHMPRTVQTHATYGANTRHRQVSSVHHANTRHRQVSSLHRACAHAPESSWISPSGTYHAGRLSAKWAAASLPRVPAPLPFPLRPRVRRGLPRVTSRGEGGQRGVEGG